MRAASQSWFPLPRTVNDLGMKVDSSERAIQQKHLMYKAVVFHFLYIKKIVLRMYPHEIEERRKLTRYVFLSNLGNCVAPAL